MRPYACTFALAAPLCLNSVIAGCAPARARNQVWTPAPRVTWQELGNQPPSSLENGFHISAAGPTRGLFPTPVAVTRVAVADAANGRAPVVGRTVLQRDPRNEFLRWNSTFDYLMAVSEVFPIEQRDLGGAPAETPAILAAARAFKARLGLVYAFNELTESEAEMFGVLYDAVAARPLAQIHARAQSTMTPRERQSRRANLWETDARALVREQFERHLRSCMRELILADEPAEVVAPEGWRPIPPTLPPAWPPLASPAPN